MKLLLPKPKKVEKRGRKPLGEKAMSPYERLKKHRQAKKQKPSE
jgi:hypothetical protein